MTGQPEAITEAELDWVLRFHSSGLTAQGLIREIKDHYREPEYEPGEVYRDADGATWEYRPDSDGICPWLKPGGEGRWSTPTPRRPLRRLVPEGSEATARKTVDRGQIINILAAGGAHTCEWLSGKADRICEYLEEAS